MKILAKIEAIKNTLIALAIVVAIVIVACLIGVYFVGDYVQQNYIVVSSKSPVQSKQAFLWEYTTKTGDMTLATATGNEGAFADRITNIDASNITWSDTDYRPLVRLIASTWIQQGRNVDSPARSKYNEIMEDLGDNVDVFIDKDTWVSKYGDQNGAYGIYEKDWEDFQDYSYTYSGFTFSINSARCCCCLSESLGQFLVKFDAVGLDYNLQGHTAYTGATAKDREIMSSWSTTGRDEDKQYYFNQNAVTYNGVARYRADSLLELTRGNTAITLEDLIQSGVLKPGCIITFGTTRNNPSTDTIPGSPAHVEFVVYIDDNYVYTAGAGNGRHIMQDATIGCNSRWDRSKALLDMNWDSTNRSAPIINFIYWSDSVNVTRIVN